MPSTTLDAEPLAIRLADYPDERPNRRFLVPHPSTFANFTACPWATTRIVRDVETGRPLLCPVTCKRWGCSYCAPRKIRRLAFLTKGAEPNRWIRLGVNPALYDSPKAAWEDTSPKVPELCRILRKTRGEVEYLRVAEIHNGTTRYAELDEPGKALGFPHYHALLRSSYIPQKELSAAWGDLTGAPVVWIAKISQTFSSFRYLTKYLTKLHRLEWTDRHVSYSKKFFREEDMEKLAYPERDLIEVSEKHPWKLLADRYADQEVTAHEDGTYLLPDHADLDIRDTSMIELGLRPPDGPYREPPQVPQNLPGLEDTFRPTYDDQPF
jgi:hypothetical protein